MTFIIVKAKVGYIVRHEVGMHEVHSACEWAAFDSWEQAAAWIGKQFRAEGGAP